MRIRVAYTTTYVYDRPPGRMVQILKLTPRSHETQHVANWRVDVYPDGKLWRREDPLGNIAHTLYLSQAASELTITVHGDVETFDSNGMLRGTVERFPDEIFLRPTLLTEPDVALAQFAQDSVAGVKDGDIARLHALMGAVNKAVAFDTTATKVEATAAEAFQLGRGVCQDLTHIFIAAARKLGYPARYVSGHLANADGRELEASHAWAEAKAPGLGWIGFDPTNDICPTDAYLRVAIGLDYLGAAPVRGSRYGGGAEVLDVRLKAADAVAQSQTQA
jgi:transglutaminase-like putative cysteine protease